MTYEQIGELAVAVELRRREYRRHLQNRPRFATLAGQRGIGGPLRVGSLEPLRTAISDADAAVAFAVNEFLDTEYRVPTPVSGDG